MSATGYSYAQSSSYINSSATYSWIDASSHSRVRAYLANYPYPENSTDSVVTITIASPGVVTWPAHGLAAGTPVVLSTTGATPTGYTAGTIYYVRNPAANTFQLSATSGGAAINTTGTQSGVHTARARSSVLAFPRTGPPYFFYTPAGSTCGTSGTIIDDRLSDAINIGFTFNYGGLPFTTVRISSNGRIQFNNNLTCGNGTDNGSPTIYTYDYPDAGMNYSMRIYGADLDSSPKSFKDGTFAATPVNPSYNTNCLDDVQCYVSVSTIGSAPTRKFVITWNNVPKWTTGAVIAGNFNLQLILEEGGDFVYQFGNVADSQPNVPAQIGWQVNANDYDIKQTALPANNSAIRYTAPRPLAQYQMEQASWTSAAGQVLDTSGNDNHGTRLGAAQTTASGYSCNGANIPGNASAGVIDGIDTRINISSQIGGVGTMTFWYKPNAWVGSTAAAVDGQLFDASNALNAWFYMSKLRVNNTTTKLRFAVRDSTGTTRFVETAGMSNSVLSAGGWVHIGLSWNFNTLSGTNQDRLRIYVNGSAIGSGNSVQSLFTSAGALATGIDTLTIGDNRSTFLESPGGTANSANGVIDEVRIYKLEAGYSQILTDYTRQAGCPNHYAITHAGSGASPTNGRTCVSNRVTITSHTTGDAAIPSAATITISTSTGQGTWALTTGLGTLTPGPANSGTATYKFNNESQVVLAFTHTNVANVNINVTDGTFSEQTGPEDANLNVAFCANPNFTGCEYTSGRCTIGTAGYDQLFTKLAGRAFKLDALAISLTNTLESAFNGTVSVDLLANTSPTAPQPDTNCPASQTAVVPLGNITFVNGRFPGTGVPVGAGALAAVSPFYSAYRDVRMRFTCDSTNCPPSGVTVCSRDAFAVRPTDFTISSPANNTSVTTGTPRVVAGTAFNMSAVALTAGGASALGYNGTPQIPDNTKVQAQWGPNVGDQGATTALVDANDNTVALFGSASATTAQANTQLYYKDYGGFRILPGGLQDTAFVDPAIDPPGTDCVANNYTNTDLDLDADREKFSCVVANQSNSLLVGRFYPSSLPLVSQVTQGCTGGAFTYEGQQFAVSATITARTSGAVIAASTMRRYSMPVFFAAENANDGVNLLLPATPRIPQLMPSPGTWSDGVYTANVPNAIFTRAASPDGPFDSLDIGICVTDPDTTLASLDMNVSQSPVPANCPGTGFRYKKLTGSPIKMRFGRLQLSNAYGSERLNLPMQVEAQYWSGGTFVRNIADGCTALTTNNVSLVNQQAPVTTTNVTVGSAGTLAAGVGSIVLNAPNPNTPWANIGNVDVILNFGAATTSTCPTATPANPLGASSSAGLAFLATNGCSAATYTRNPAARASFGVYVSPIIYGRENY